MIHGSFLVTETKLQTKEIGDDSDVVMMVEREFPAHKKQSATLD